MAVSTGTRRPYSEVPGSSIRQLRMDCAASDSVVSVRSTVATLRGAYFGLKRDAAPGVDGQTRREYGEQLEDNLKDLSGRLKRGAYRAKSVRRVLIPQPDGGMRPLGVTTLEDKLVQRAVAEVLNQIYEADFLGFSYGFRWADLAERFAKFGLGACMHPSRRWAGGWERCSGGTSITTGCPRTTPLSKPSATTSSGSGGVLCGGAAGRPG